MNRMLVYTGQKRESNHLKKKDHLYTIYNVYGVCIYTHCVVHEEGRGRKMAAVCMKRY